MVIKSLIGTWDLLSFRHHVIKANKTINIMGEHPKGKIIFSEDNYVSVIITAETRQVDLSCKEKSQSNLYCTMMSYVARFDFNNDICNFYIDTAWNPSWCGLKLERKISIDNNILTICTLPQIGIDGEASTATLIWKKIY